MESTFENVEDWIKIAFIKQMELNDALGSRKWDEIQKSDLFVLKKKIGFACCGKPKDMPASNNYYTGYNIDDLELIKPLSEQIINISDCNPIRFACTFLCLYSNNEMALYPVFRIVNTTGNVFVDINRRVYQNWEHFKTDNQLPKCSYCAPSTGEYTDSELNLEVLQSPACSFLSQAKDGVDIVATGTVIGGTIASIFFSAPILIPVIGVASAYHAGQSFFTLYDRKKHEQTINLNDRDARNAWLNIAGSAVGVGTVAALGKAKKIVDGGKQLSKLALFGIQALNTTSLVFSGFGFVDNLLLCKEKYVKGTLAPIDVFHLSCELLFFYNAISSVQATSNLLTKMSQVQVSEGASTKVKLTKTQKRNLRKKLSKQRAKLATLNNENSGSSRTENILSGLAAGLLFKITKGCVPVAEELLFRYYSIGHDIKCWINKETSIEDLLQSLLRKLPTLYNEIIDDIKYMMEVIKNLKLKVKEYFYSASSDQQAQFCISIQNFDNQIESLIKNFNEEILDPNTTSENPNENVDLRESLIDLEDDEGISTQTHELFTKIEESVLSDFKCSNLMEYNSIAESVEAVIVEEFMEQTNKYKKSVDAAKSLNPAFDLDQYNEALGITGDCGQYFFNEILNSIHAKRITFKIKYELENKLILSNGQCLNTNILEGNGKAYSFETKRENIKTEIFFILRNKLKVDNLEENNFEIYEARDEEFTMLFIHSKDNLEDKTKIIVYFKTDEDKTTTGIINLY